MTSQGGREILSFVMMGVCKLIVSHMTQGSQQGPAIGHIKMSVTTYFAHVAQQGKPVDLGVGHTRKAGQ